jgi:hypothetical protein
MIKSLTLLLTILFSIGLSAQEIRSDTSSMSSSIVKN